MVVYNIIDLLLLIILVATTMFLSKRRYLEYEFYFKFSVDDELHTKEADSLPGTNTIYATNKGLSRYIKKYVFSRNGDDRLLILNYTKPFENIDYYVVCLNKKNRVVEVLETIEKNTTTTSKIIGLHRDTAYVNIILKTVDGLAINSQIIKPMQKRDIKTYAFLKSISIFSILCLIRDVSLLLLFKPYRYEFLNSFYVLISTGAFVGVAFIAYMLYKRSCKKRNIKIRSGGILEYEFF